MDKEDIEYGLYVRNKKTGKRADIMSQVDDREWGSVVKVLVQPQDCGGCHGAAWETWNIRDIERAN